MTALRGGLSRLLGSRTAPRHSAADQPNGTNVYELNRRALIQFWRPEKDDEIGAWCVVVKRPGTPATGNPSIAAFAHEEHARHIADIHNEWLDRQVRNK